jgi:NitT/TauT family transport system permease protein
MRRFEKSYGALAILLVWQAASMSGLLNPFFLPPPSRILYTLFLSFATGSLWPDLANTIYRLIVGYTIGVAIGVPLGLIVGGFQRIYAWCELLIDFFRSIPVTSLFPLFLFLFGIGDPCKFAIIAYAVTLINLFNTMYGVKNSSKTRLLVAKVFGANTRQQFSGVILPEAFPQIVVGLRLSLSSALIYVIVTEMFLGTTQGLGYRIYNANLTYEIPDMYASILLTGLLGYCVNQGLLLLENRLVLWRTFA